MIASYDFCCTRPGCKATVHVTMHMHNDHQWDLEQLGSALGFRRVGDPLSFKIDGVTVAVGVRDEGWQCSSHDPEAPRG